MRSASLLKIGIVGTIAAVTITTTGLALTFATLATGTLALTTTTTVASMLMSSDSLFFKIVLLYYERSNLPCEFPKWSNVPVKFPRSNVVNFSLPE